MTRTALNPGWVGRDVAGRVRAGVERVAFWLAVALPFVSLPYLLVGTLAGGFAYGGTVLAALLAANLVALVLGHRHDPARTAHGSEVESATSGSEVAGDG